MMNYLSVCSGIESATVAWHALGWNAVSFSEIEPFPCAVLSHHYPAVPNLGDLTLFDQWPEELLAQADILVGGTPCQAFSVAGSRKSLDDDRGNLTLIYAKLFNRIDSIRVQLHLPPAICVWENVPGVLSTRDNAFGCFLAELAGEDTPLLPPGGRWTDAGFVRGPQRTIGWRTLDAQYFGLAQRRKRVFVVASAGDFHPEEILFEFKGLRRDSPPSRRTGESAAGNAQCGFEVGGTLGPRVSRLTTDECAQGSAIVAAPLIPEVYPTIDAQMDRKWGSNQWVNNGFAVIEPHCMAHGQANAAIGINIGTTLTCLHESPIVFKPSHYTRDKDGAPSEVAGPLSAEADRGDQEQVVLAFQTPVAYDLTQITSPTNRSNPQPGDPCHPLVANGASPVVSFYANESRCNNIATDGSSVPVKVGSTGSSGNPPAVAFESRIARNGRGAPSEVVPPLKAQSGESGKGDAAPLIATPMSVRRLTPRECERLQGFPDDYTLIPYRGKPAADGPRYKALGNSKAVPVVRWIGRRIQQYLNQTTIP
jgi:DNA (cytosine-5)-methyltransferase 1